jgi:hypothetical protein
MVPIAAESRSYKPGLADLRNFTERLNLGRQFLGADDILDP